MKYSLSVLLISTFWIILYLLSQSCTADSKAKKIEELMTYCYRTDIFNGAVLVAHEGKILYQSSFGCANFSTMERLKSSSAFCIGSIGKQFTAMAVMILKEQNKLDYEDKLTDYFPEFPDYADGITVRHLLNHTSGISNWMKFSMFRARPGDFKDDITNKDVFEFLLTLDSLDFTPGEKYAYSNSGYILLAMIVEKVSGEPFYKFMEHKIFNPLGMKNTLVWNETKPEIPNKTIGYNQFGEKDDYNILTSGAGSIYSTIEDLYKWDQGLYSDKLVSQETLKEAFTPGRLNNGAPSRTLGDLTWDYGFGWLLRKNESENIVWHDGGFNGFNAIFYRELNRHDLIIFLTNKGEPWPLYPIHEAVKSILRDEPYELPPVPLAVRMKKMIDEYGLTESINRYHQLRKTHPVEYDFSERQLNSLGYYYLKNQKFNEAKTVLKLNVEIYPNSSNVYDSYGEACLGNGDYDEAIDNYRRSLELNADNKNALEMLKKINARKNIE